MEGKAVLFKKFAGAAGVVPRLCAIRMACKMQSLRKMLMLRWE